ncbi:MAG: hypothetical protein PQJ46_11650 [Spirochaetales bacterium]|nr:hypothetical protein [Spirochaetales bacterium]
MNKDEIKIIMTTKSIDRARSEIIEQLKSDRFKISMEIAENVEEILTSRTNLFEENRTTIISEKQKWTPDYWIITIENLSRNFSKENLQHSINIMLWLRKQGHPNFQAMKNNSAIHSYPIKTDYLINICLIITAGTCIGAVAGTVLAEKTINGALIGLIISAATGLLCISRTIKKNR